MYHLLSNRSRWRSPILLVGRWCGEEEGKRKGGFGGREEVG